MTSSRGSCSGCECGTSTLAPAELSRRIEELKGWEIVDGSKLAKTLEFADFATALAFVNALGAVAEELGHHPDVALSWGRVRVEIWTHSVSGLTEADFDLATKVDRIER